MTKNIDKLIEEVRAAADNKGLKSFRQIGAAADIDHTILANLLTYRRRPSMDKLVQLARGLDANPTDWLKLAGYYVDPGMPNLDRIGVELRATGRLSEDDIKVVEDVMKRILEEEDRGVEGS